MIYKGVELYNIEQVIPTSDGNGVLLCRLPETVRSQINQGAQGSSLHTCGCEIRFNMVSESVTIRLQRPLNPFGVKYGIAEVYFGAFQADYQTSPQCIGDTPTDIRITKPKWIRQLWAETAKMGLPYDPDVVRVILPYDFETHLIEIIGDTTPPRRDQTPAGKYLCYGSSITHGGSANTPTGTYAMRTAKALGVDLINLGFAGSAQMDEAVATYIAGRTDWDFATIEMGINVIGQWDEDLFRSKVNTFVTTVAAAHPNKWIFCIDLFQSDRDLRRDDRLEAYRNIVRKQVKSMDMPKLVYISGNDLLSDISGLSADLVHPSADGFEQIAYRLAQRISAATGREHALFQK